MGQETQEASSARRVHAICPDAVRRGARFALDRSWGCRCAASSCVPRWSLAWGRMPVMPRRCANKH